MAKAERVYFTQIPNMVLDWLARGVITASEFTLYSVIRRTAGDDGICKKSISTLADEARLSKRTITEARQSLREKGLISIERVGYNGSARVICRVVDIWERNSQAFIEQKNRTILHRYTNDECKIARQPMQNSDTKKNNRRRTHSSPPSSSNGESGNSGNPTGITHMERAIKESNPPSDESNPPVTDKSRERATKLLTALAENNSLERKASMKSWTKEIDGFIRDADVDEKEFDSVLDWYCRHVDGEYIPQAYSARGFCDRYMRIRKAMMRVEQVEVIEEVRKPGGVILVESNGESLTPAEREEREWAALSEEDYE